ncbi:MAG: hypothetical protein LAT67_10675 [Balneolales bacterium]|nr:hypothetical protein [Balneolales bacterium]
MAEPKPKPTKEKADKVVTNYVGAAVAAAVIPIPLADALTISAVQVSMGMHIAHGVYNRDIGADTFKVFAGSYMASDIALWAWSLVKTIPIFGTKAGVIGQMTIAGSVTAALGFGLVQLLDKGEEVTASNLKRAARQNKDRAVKLSEEIVNQQKEALSKLNKVRFQQDNYISHEAIVFRFNLEGICDPVLKVSNLQNASEKLYALNNRDKEYTLDIRTYEKGQYKATLIAPKIPDINLFFTKE